MGAVRTLQRIFMWPHDMSWARHSHSSVRERSPDIPVDGVMQDAAYLLRRIPLPPTPVNKGVRRLPEETSPVTAQRPRGAKTGRINAPHEIRPTIAHHGAAVEPGRDR